MRRVVFAVWAATIAATLWAWPATAQERVWVQIEAQPSLSEAEGRVRAYANVLPDVNGFRLPAGWYAIALGPYAPEDARAILRQLRATRRIPGDSFVADGSNFRGQFWPVGAQLDQGETQPLDEPVTAIPLRPAEETPAESRAAERDLTRAERELVQTALKWDGFYTAAIDGAFGRGTRGAMAEWQAANGYEPTGMLSTAQRRDLVEGYTDVLDGLGFRTRVDEVAGIEITLPSALIRFDAYEPPFARFDAADDSGVRVLLLSQTGDEATLAGLYDIMQTLEIVPLDGFRERRARSFVLTGANDSIVSHTYAQLSNGHVKGFTLIWPPEDEKRRLLALETMQESFRALPDAVLPDEYGVPEEQSIDLLAGLAIRRPQVSRSGFYVSGDGAVLTTSAAVTQCRRITLDETRDAEIAALDLARGMALLRPEEEIAPLAFARFQPGVPRLGSEVAIAGFPFEGRLGAPSVTFGSVAELTGLDGDETVKRLAVETRPGDGGGPVLSNSGAVLGMLRAESDGARQLPAGVEFAVDTVAIAEFLSGNGLSAAASDAQTAMAPEDLAAAAADMTVLVSCWN